MNPFKVVLIANDDSHPLPDWVVARLCQAGVELVHHECFARADLANCAGDADVIWLMSSRKGLVVEENMDLFQRAGAVIKCGSGTDNIDHDACTKRGIIVAHTPDDPTEPTSDHAIAMLFAAVRQVARQDRLTRRGIWDQAAALPLGQFTGAELGLVGLGRIGKAIVRKLAGFRMTVRVYDPYLEANTIESAGAQKAGLDELLRKSQFVVLSCPLTPETRRLIGMSELRLMRPDSVLVNCARGGIVDEEALLQALQEGRIKAAALDVLETLPKPGEGLMACENVVFTPHLGGSTADPSDVFRTPLEVILGMSQRRLPPWIANNGVVSKWQREWSANEDKTACLMREPSV